MSRSLEERGIPSKRSNIRTRLLGAKERRVRADDAGFHQPPRTPIEPKSFSTHSYACLRALGIGTRGLYCAKDTFVSLALTAGVNVYWLEGQVGVSYLVLRKHYGRYMTSEGPDQLAKMAVAGAASQPELQNARSVS